MNTCEKSNSDIQSVGLVLLYLDWYDLPVISNWPRTDL